MTSLPKFLREDRVFDAVLIPFLSVAQAGAMGVGAFATRDAFTALHGGTSPDVQTLGLLAMSGLAIAVMTWAIKQRAEAMGQSYANTVRVTLYRHLAGMDLSALEQRRVGALSLRFVGDLSAVRNWFGRGMPLAISASFVLPGAGLALWLLQPVLALAAFAVLIVAVLITLACAVGLERRHQRLRRKRANLSIAMIERVAVAPLLDLMGRTGKELVQLKEKGTVLRRDALYRTGQRNGLSALIDAGAAMAGIAVFLVAGHAAISPGTVAATLAMIAVLVAPLRELTLVWDRFCAWRVARRKLHDLLAQPSSRRRLAKAAGPVHVTIAGAITREFAAGETHVLQKSDATLLRVIAGLDRPRRFAVRFDGDAARPRLAYLGEAFPILQGSLRRAVTLGLRPRPADDTIMRVLSIFGIAHLAEGPDGLSVRVAEGGRNLARDERIRVELVRAALAKAQLLLIEAARLRADPAMVDLIRGAIAGWKPTLIIGADDAPARSDRVNL